MDQCEGRKISADTYKSIILNEEALAKIIEQKNNILIKGRIKLSLKVLMTILVNEEVSFKTDSFIRSDQLIIMQNLHISFYQAESSVARIINVLKPKISKTIQNVEPISNKLNFLDQEIDNSSQRIIEIIKALYDKRIDLKQEIIKINTQILKEFSTMFKVVNDLYNAKLIAHIDSQLLSNLGLALEYYIQVYDFLKITNFDFNNYSIPKIDQEIMTYIDNIADDHEFIDNIQSKKLPFWSSWIYLGRIKKNLEIFQRQRSTMRNLNQRIDQYFSLVRVYQELSQILKSGEYGQSFKDELSSIKTIFDNLRQNPQINEQYIQSLLMQIQEGLQDKNLNLRQILNIFESAGVL